MEQEQIKREDATTLLKEGKAELIYNVASEQFSIRMKDALPLALADGLELLKLCKKTGKVGQENHYEMENKA